MESSYEKLQPEDPLTLLPLDKEILDVLGAQFVFTIRHFAACNRVEIVNFCQDEAQRKYTSHLYEVANRVVANAVPFKPNNSAEVWGYVYVSEDFYEYTRQEQMLKSSYVLFHDYVNTPVEDRILHPWVRIFHRYVKEASTWCRVAEPTDLDVYSYLLWRAVPSFAELDYTAGPRAIYFNWWCLRPDAHKTCLAADRMLSKQSNDFLLAQRNERVLQINLTAVMKHCQGGAKIFRIEPHQDNRKWIPTTLEEAKYRANDSFRTALTIVPGEDFYSNTFAHGCIVTPTGTIPGEFISVSDKIELEDD